MHQGNAQIRSKNLKFNGSVEVNFEISEDEDMWATMYVEIVEQVCGKIRNTEQIQNCLKKIGNCTTVVNKGVVKELKVLRPIDPFNTIFLRPEQNFAGMLSYLAIYTLF